MSFLSSLISDVKQGLGFTESKLTYKSTGETVNAPWDARTGLKAILAPLATVPAVASLAGKAVVSGVTTAATTVKTAFSTLKPTTKVLTVAAAVPATGFITSSKKAQEGLLNLPSASFNFGSNVGQFIDNPSISSATTIAKENPLITGAVVGGSALALGYAGKTLVSSYLISESAQDLKKAAGNTLNSTNVSGNPISGTDSNRFDARINEKQTELALDLEKEKTKQLEMQLKANEKLASLNPSVTKEEIPQAVVSSPVKKKTTKKKAKKKKAKKKTTKKKAKKKTTKKKKKSKTIKRKTTKRR